MVYFIFKVLYVLYIFCKLTRKFYGINILTGEKVMCLNNGSIFSEIITYEKEPFIRAVLFVSFRLSVFRKKRINYIAQFYFSVNIFLI